VYKSLRTKHQECAAQMVKSSLWFRYMVHGLCGAINPLSPSMVDKKCTKKCSGELFHETRTGYDRYPKYIRRKSKDGGRITTIRMINLLSRNCCQMSSKQQL